MDPTNTLCLLASGLVEDSDSKDGVRTPINLFALGPDGFIHIGVINDPDTNGYFISFDRQSQRLLIQRPTEAFLWDAKAKKGTKIMPPPDSANTNCAHGLVIPSSIDDRASVIFMACHSPAKPRIVQGTCDDALSVSGLVEVELPLPQHAFKPRDAPWSLCPLPHNGNLLIGFLGALVEYDPKTQTVSPREVPLDKFRLSAVRLLPEGYDCQTVLAGYSEKVDDHTCALMFLPPSHPSAVNSDQAPSPAKTLYIRDEKWLGKQAAGSLDVVVLPKGGVEPTANFDPDSWLLAVSGARGAVLIVELPPAGFADGLVVAPTRVVEIPEHPQTLGLGLCPLSVATSIPGLVRATPKASDDDGEAK